MPAKGTHVPDPLRNVGMDDVIRITEHPAFEKPADIDAAAWTAAVEAVRKAVAGARLNVVLEVGSTRYQEALCHGADDQMRTYGTKPADLHNPVVDAVLEQIALFLAVRVRLGRHEQLKGLIGAIKAGEGRVPLHDLNRQGFSTIMQTMRAIVAKAGETSAKRKEALWGYIREFLAEQAGLPSVDFPEQRFRNDTAEADLDDELRAAGITLTHGRAVVGSRTRLETREHEALEAVQAHLRAITAVLPTLPRKLQDARTKQGLLSARLTATETGELNDFFTRRSALETAKKDLLETLEVEALDPRDERAFGQRLRELEDEFAEPLATYKAGKAELELAERQIEDLERLKEDLKGRQAKLTAFIRLLEEYTGDEVDECAEAWAAGPATAPPAAPALRRAPAPSAPLVRPAIPAPTPFPTSIAAPLAPRASVPKAALNGSGNGSFEVGGRVSHVKFGGGTVIFLEADSTTVRFDDLTFGTKVIRNSFLTH